VCKKSEKASTSLSLTIDNQQFVILSGVEKMNKFDLFTHPRWGGKKKAPGLTFSSVLMPKFN